MSRKIEDENRKRTTGRRKIADRKPKNKSGQTGYRGHESGSERNGTPSQFNEEIEEIW